MVRAFSCSIAASEHGRRLLTDYIALPKAEVHIHVEGCFEADDVIRNCEESGIPLRAPRDRLFEAHGG